MGTRGIYGYRLDGIDKVTSNHTESSPKTLGRQLLQYIADSRYDSMLEAADRIVMVNSCDKPDSDLIERYEKYSNTGVGGQNMDTWDCLLRNTQGNLQPYHSDLKHMIDGQDFLSESQFCEWAYILNLDTDHFEIYKGLNKNPYALGRYAPMGGIESEYRGVVLVEKLSMQSIFRKSLAFYDKYVSNLET